MENVIIDDKLITRLESHSEPA